MLGTPRCRPPAREAAKNLMPFIMKEQSTHYIDQNGEEKPLPLIRTSRNRHLHNYPIREITGPSLTVPDQTMSLRTLLERHSRGLPIMGTSAQPIYLEDGDPGSEGINFKQLDLVEKSNLLEAYSDEFKTLKTQQMEEDTKKKKSALKEALKRELEEEQKQSENKPPENQGV